MDHPSRLPTFQDIGFTVAATLDRLQKFLPQINERLTKYTSFFVSEVMENRKVKIEVQECPFDDTSDLDNYDAFDEETTDPALIDLLTDNIRHLTRRSRKYVVGEKRYSPQTQSQLHKLHARFSYTRSYYAGYLTRAYVLEESITKDFIAAQSVRKILWWHE